MQQQCQIRAATAAAAATRGRAAAVVALHPAPAAHSHQQLGLLQQWLEHLPQAAVVVQLVLRAAAVLLHSQLWLGLHLAVAAMLRVALTVWVLCAQQVCSSHATARRQAAGSSSCVAGPVSSQSHSRRHDNWQAVVCACVLGWGPVWVGQELCCVSNTATFLQQWLGGAQLPSCYHSGWC